MPSINFDAINKAVIECPSKKDTIPLKNSATDLDKVYNHWSIPLRLRWCKNHLESVKPKITWKTAVFPLLGLTGFFIYIYFFQVDILGIIVIMQTANPYIYTAAILFGLLEVLFFSISWRELTNYLSIKMSIGRAYLYVWYGLYIDTIVPAQSISGEVTRTYLLGRDKCGSFGKIVASLFAHRLLGMAVNVIALIAGIILLYIGGQASPIVFNLIIIVATTITALIFLMIIFSYKQQWTLKAITWATNLGQRITFGRLKSEKIKNQTIEITEHFHIAMKELRHNPKSIATSLFYLIITWIFSLSVPFMIFLSLDHPVSWSMILVTSSIVLAVKAIPVGIPFEVGLPEAVMTTLYFSMGVPATIAATATILIRIITLWMRFFIGFFAQQYIEFKPSKSSTANPEKTKIHPQP